MYGLQIRKIFQLFLFHVPATWSLAGSCRCSRGAETGAAMPQPTVPVALSRRTQAGASLVSLYSSCFRSATCEMSSPPCTPVQSAEVVVNTPGAYWPDHHLQGVLKEAQRITSTIAGWEAHALRSRTAVLGRGWHARAWLLCCTVTASGHHKLCSVANIFVTPLAG